VRTEVRTLLDELAGDQPEPAVDLDRLIARGRRRNRIRTTAFGVASITLAAGLAAGVLTLRPGGPDAVQPAGPQPTPTVSAGSFPGASQQRSTAKSTELADQLRSLAPEIDRIPGAQKSDAERFGPDGTPAGHLSAESIWTYPAADGQNMVGLHVEVGVAHNVPPVCDGMAPGVNKCSEVRRLGDGSTAYIHNYTAVGGHQYEVRLVRPDGTWVYVGSVAQKPAGSTHDAPLPAERVLDIAQRITVVP
jgi:hypothetical protein